MNLNRLLRRLIRMPGFARSAAPLTLPDGTRTTVRDWCVPASTAYPRCLNLRRIFWGTIRYAHVDDDGGAWLNLGRGDQPTIRLKSDFSASLLTGAHITDAADLLGAAFSYYGHLRRSSKNDRL
ncbi:hypothetical protein [Clavibacter sp. VKM Ac-2872]|uniref:hypothetical protein n=1 Tax=Clavibacter sp. VKM Ac-2872 TaxID=2783812 RepID=UPI00188C4CB0|nr:hypothetical protein [Clavibacter sp. VKM Ac-2872]MBF4622773.1 hypothetical protein [Clavibacter sp. VKM Ac-2872]